MITGKSLLKVANDLQALGLINANLKLVKKKNIQPKDVLKTGISNILGTELIKVNAQAIGELD